MEKEDKKILDEFVDILSKATVARFNHEGKVDPVAFGLTNTDGKNGLVIVDGIQEFFDSDAGKEMAAKIIKDMIHKTNAIAVCVVMEGWGVKIDMKDKDKYFNPDGSYKPGAKPVDNPDRQEIVLLTFETEDKECSRLYNIVEKDGKRELSLMEQHDWHDKQKENNSVFCNLMTDNYNPSGASYENDIRTKN